jgi:hypothetical protein
VSHIGEIIVAVIGIPVFLAIVLSLGRSIRRAGRMDPGSQGYVPLDPGGEHHGGPPHGGGHSHHHGGHNIGGGHMGGGHHG